MALTISDMTVGGTSVINSETVAGYGMVFAKNGAIRSALLPVTAEDLQLSAGQSINLLIPGGRNKAYTLDGSFETTTGGSVRLRRGAEASLSEETVEVSATGGTFEQFTGTTLNAAGTYNIIFGDNKIICKVVDADDAEHPYSKISDAIADIVATAGANPPYALTTAKTATIEMVTDYLLTASDDVNIPQGYDITLTTAAKEGAKYCYNGTGNRAIISRDTQNTDSMIKAWNALESNKVVTTLRLKNLIIDGKSVRGSSDGGAVATQYVNVYIDTVDFKNVYASNGGALLVMFNFNRTTTKEVKDTLPGTILEVNDSDFTGCTSTTTVTSNRLGGGAIVTNAETMTLEDCDFTNCTAVDQAGAVFHRVDKNNNSWTNITGCTFTNCSANAAGGLELDSKTITVTDCTFEHCVATQRNGGGFNVYALNASTPTADCWVTVSGCTFNDCQLTTTNTSNGNGGGFRCNAVYTKVENSTFTNNQALYGGGFCISNGNAKKGEVYGCTFERNTANNGGGIYGKPAEFIIGDYTYTDSEGVVHTRHTEIKNCTSKNHGGGLYHDKNADNTSLTITNAVITGNRTTANSMNGGGVYTNCRKVEINGAEITDNTCTSAGGGVYAYSYTSLTITDSDISRNNASGNGGGVWFDADNDTNRAKQVLTIKGSTIDGNTSNGNGGGVYTLGKTVTIGASDTKTDSNGKYIRSSISNNSAKNGGGVYQSRNVAGSKLEISDTSISGNAANGGTGGGVYAGVRTLTVTSTEISRNSATSDGGGIWYEINNDDARKAMKLTVEGCTLDTNTSGGKGGGIYTLAKTVEIKEHTEGTGEDAVTTPTTISNCTASASGGGIYQSRNVDGSVLNITGSTISGCTSNDTSTAWDHGGGGVFGYVRSITVTGSEISGNSAKGKGGGIVMGLESNDYMLTIDSSSVTGNTSSNQGGGVATRSQLTLRNGTEITGNRLTSNTAGDCAGVYLNNNRTLFVGSEDADTDTIIVRGNTTANGTLSDLRLWDNGSENNSTSTYVYCSLSDDSEIRVVNAAKVSTWFGSAEIAYPNGFSDDNAVFRADSSTLHGIIDRTDPNGKKIIWAGPPIAKLTDGGGTLLYIRYTEGGALYPAIFDRLDTGNSSAGSTVSPFNMFRMSDMKLYYTNGTEYTGSNYCIKMLVEYYETNADMTLPYVEGRRVTFTTAGKNDTDGYPFEGRAGGRATVIRAYAGSTNRTLMNVSGNLVLENIVIDGGTENGIAVTGSTRCMWIDNDFCTVTLGENAVLQNGHVKTDTDGGGVYVNKGAFEIKGGTIRNCTARDGGGVYLNNGSITLTAGSIYQCTASGSGGGVRTKSGSFSMSGGTIQGCSALGTSGGGGGVCVAGGQSMYMSGGSIINNSAVGTGGGIMVYSNASRLYFSGKVNISGNTSEASVAKNHACNVELNYDSNAVINTNNGGLYAGSYIGVYVPDGTSLYDKHGAERKPFGTFVTGDNTATFYSFVNDRNGLKGGIIENPSPNTIYWIKIFSLEVSKEVESGDSTAIDSDEQFLFKVNIRGNATVTGQLNAAQIDSDDGEYGEMHFDSNGRDTTTAVFALKDGESITGVNLSEGLKYEVIEYLTVEQADRYAAMPMNGYNLTTESLTYNGTTYRVIKANTYTSTIGENKSRSDVDPYTSSLKFTNLMPVCKITDMSGNLLYRRYDWDKVTNKTGEGEDGGSSTNQPFYYAPAVYTELTGDDGAFKALEGTLYTSNGSNPTSYSVSNGVQIQMLIADYSLYGLVAANTSKATLTTASSGDALFPKQDAGTTSTIRRAFADDSMFNVTGDLTLSTIILDGVKGSYTIEANGGIANVQSGGKLTIQSGAVLQNSRSAENYYGGAVYVASGGSVTMTGGMINRNESVDNGAGIYLAEGSTLKLSDAPSFGGTGRDVSGNITTTNGNFKTGDLVAQTNGGKAYSKARQDIYIAEAQDDPASVVLTGNLNVDAGSIWVWAATENHYAMMKPFATFASGTVNGNTYAAFRNAQPDGVTNCGEDNYLSGSSGENALFIYWAGGFDVSFKMTLFKTDGGAESVGTSGPKKLSGGEFALFVESRVSPQSIKFGGSSVFVARSGSVRTSDRGVALNLEFGKTYYLQETKAPENYVSRADGLIRIAVSTEGVVTVESQAPWLEGEVTYEDTGVREGTLTVTNQPCICKITDEKGYLLYTKRDGKLYPAVFGRLRDAMAVYEELYEAGGAAFDEQENPIELQMLVDYAMPNADTLELAQDQEVTFTTASRAAADGYPYRGRGSTALVSRGFSGRSMILVKEDAVLTLEDITLDGAKGSDRTASGDGGIAEVKNQAELAILDGTVLQNSKSSGNGGAVSLSGDAVLTLGGDALITDCETSRNGGAVYAGGTGVSITMKDDASVESCKAGSQGGAFYLYNNAELHLDDEEGGAPGIRRNSANSGAGVYLAGEESRIFLKDSPEFEDNLGRKLSGATNGGEDYPQARQDIFLEFSAVDDAPNIVVTGDLALDPGALWVWPGSRNHALGEKQFAVIASGTEISDETFLVFRNAVDDRAAENRSGAYYTGTRGENERCIYWSVPGVDVQFKKVDSFGEPLAGAEFTLFLDPECGTALDRPGRSGSGGAGSGGDESGEAVTAVSADGSASHKGPDGETLAKGTVLFEKIPGGIYYMKETAFPEGYRAAGTGSAGSDGGGAAGSGSAGGSGSGGNAGAGGSGGNAGSGSGGASGGAGSGGNAGSGSNGSSGAESGNVYVVAAGEAALETIGSGVLEDITAENLEGWKDSGNGSPAGNQGAGGSSSGSGAQAAVFLLDEESGKALASPDLSRTGILNVPEAERRVILKKSDQEFLPLSGAVFDILRVDGTPAAEDAESGEGGYFWVGKLPCGVYYLHEKTAPAGYADDRWFVLRITAPGKTGGSGGDGAGSLSGIGAGGGTGTGTGSSGGAGGGIELTGPMDTDPRTEASGD